MAPERAAALVLLDGSLAEDGSAEPETPRSGRRARLLVAALRSRPAVAAWRVCGPTILTLTVPAGDRLDAWLATLAEAAADETAYLGALRDAVRAALDAGQGLSAAVPAVAAALAPLAPAWADFDATTARNAAAAFTEMEWD